MKKAVYNTIHKYIIEAKCLEPLHVGSALGDRSEVLIRETDGTPFIQASSISGVIRSYCESISKEAAVKALFGSNEGSGEGRIRVTDGEFKEGTVKLELRPRLKLNNASGTVAASQVKGEGNETSGQKLEMQYIGAGAKFSFELYVYDENEQEKTMMLKALAALDAGEIQLGGQKSNGCGYIKIDSVKSQAYDMRIPEDRKAWIGSDFSKAEKLTLPALDKSDYRNAYEITVSASTENELLVKGLTVGEFGKDAPKAENMKNASGKYIIPGSSFKGAIRNRMEMIAAYMGKDASLIEDAFGKSSNIKADGKAGNLKFRDIVLEGAEDNLRTRIRVDRLTGGVINGALFSELNVSGKLDITILVADKGNPEAVMGLLLFALRDLQSKKYAIGGGQNIGKGYLNIDEIRIADRKNKTEYVLSPDFKTVSAVESEKNLDGQELLGNFMKALENIGTAPRKQEV